MKKARFELAAEQKCVILDGDITDPWMGMDETAARALKGNIDVVINCAGLVSFNPSLEVGLNVNTHGVKFLVEACLFWDVPLVHMSTAFVAGNRSGLVFEDEEVVGYFPRKGDLDGRDFSLEQELADAEKIVARFREQADDKALASSSATSASSGSKEKAATSTDEKTLRLAIGRERKLWLSIQLVEAGMERAKHWGWPNTYTYTKSLGEQVIAATPGLRYALVRPSIVESAQHYPFPGWNEGFTTSAPIIYALMKSRGILPTGFDKILDMIPVDQVAGSLIAITAQQLRTSERRVYQQASGDSNPFIASRSVELVGLYRRRYYRRKRPATRSSTTCCRSASSPRQWARRFDTRSRSAVRRRQPSGCRGHRRAKPDVGRAQGVGAARQGPGAARRRGRAGRLAEHDRRLVPALHLGQPLRLPLRQHARAVRRHAPARPRENPLEPRSHRLAHYFLEVHMPGLEKWVFPGLDEETEKRKVVPAYRDLLELFEASGPRVAPPRGLSHARRRKRSALHLWRSASLRRAASAASCCACRSEAARPVMLMSENRPEWGMAFFGILRAGATAVPVDPELTEAEVVNIAKRAEATGVLDFGTGRDTNCPACTALLAEAGVVTQVHSLAEALAGDPISPMASAR